MKVISRIGLLVAVGIVCVAAAQPAYATCGDASPFYMAGTVLANPGASGGVAFPANATTVRGNFWGLGQFNPALATGSDNGAVSGVSETNGSPTYLYDWIRGNGAGGVYIAGDWAGHPLIDNCIQSAPNPQPANMAVLLTDTAADGTTAYYAGLCVTETGVDFDFTGLGGNPMVAIPKPRIVSSARNGTTVDVTVTNDALVGGLHNGGACALAITGFRVYARVQPRLDAAPNNRDRTSNPWTQVGAASTGQNAVITGLPCGNGEAVYLSLSLIADGVVETGYNGPNSLKVECQSNLADPDDTNFRIIRKPRNAKGR